ncbi:MAG: hypothetical protein KC458_10340, partial [Dehalococcoidia bacterium]|nr:hypothetical protein [Dehalococcoidia bacterium]
MDRRQSALLLALTAITLAVGAWVLHPFGETRLPAALRTDAGSQQGAATTELPAPADVQAAMEEAASSGFRVRIPAVGISAPLQWLQARPGNADLPAPQAPSVAGMVGGLTVDEGRHRLIVGHVNWHTGEEAVFARLAKV